MSPSSPICKIACAIGGINSIEIVTQTASSGKGREVHEATKIEKILNIFISKE